MLRAGHGLILAVLTLLVIGIVMVNSAGLVVAPDPSLLQSGQVTAEQFERMVANYRPISFEQIFFGRTTILAFISLAALAAAAFVPVDRLLTLRGASRPDADSIVSPFSRLVGTGVLFVIGLQALINVLVVTGLAPTKGIALPLLSSGGSGWVMTCFSLGLLISIERTARKNERALGIDLSASPIDSAVVAASS